jgi:SPP1 family predicted phage head-tail adaptor
MNAGELKHSITIKQRVPLQDAAGQPYETYVTILSTMAKIMPLVGKDYFAAQQIVSEVTHDITIRYTPRVKAHQIVRGGCGKVFEIMAVINDKMDSQWLFLKCKEVGGL